MVDDVENMANWIKAKAKLWNVSERELYERVELALKHKKEIMDICGLNPNTSVWHFEDYFSDLYPVDDSTGIAYDPIQRMAEVESEAMKKRLAGRAMLKAVRAKLGA